MPKSERHPSQEEGLRRSYERRKDSTERAFRDAMDRLLRGTPLLTDGKLTEANLCREAKRSRATLDRYPAVRREYAEARENRSRSAPEDLPGKIRELQETIRELRARHSAEREALLREREQLASQVFLLGLLLQRLAACERDEEGRVLLHLITER